MATQSKDGLDMKQNIRTLLQAHKSVQHHPGCAVSQQRLALLRMGEGGLRGKARKLVQASLGAKISVPAPVQKNHQLGNAQSVLWKFFFNAAKNYWLLGSFLIKSLKRYKWDPFLCDKQDTHIQIMSIGCSDRTRRGENKMPIICFCRCFSSHCFRVT